MSVNGHGVVIRMPAIVIGHHGDSDVADLGLARELGFLEIGHADHVHAPASIQIRFGQRRKRRPLHAQIRAALLDADACFHRRAVRDPRQLRADGMREADVRDQAFAEKSRDCARASGRRTGPGSTKSSGLCSSLSEPTALSERIRSTPSDFMPQMLARKFNSEGEMRWPRPCRARNATSLPASLPNDISVRRRAPTACQRGALRALQIPASNTTRCRR